jgi:hypothetical protein
MTYWIYENWWGGHRATIHLASCHHCNNGKGTDKPINNSSSKWHGPFQMFKEADRLAVQTKGTVIKCKTCTPQYIY